MEGNESEREQQLRAVWVPTIPPLTADELKERLTSLLEIQGDTLESFEAKLRVQGLTWQSTGVKRDDSPTTPPSSHTSPTTSQNSSTEHAPISATTTPEPEGRKSDSESVANIKADIPRPGPSPATDVAVGFPTSTGDLIVGEEAPKDMEFCPWRMVHKYPDWFIGKANAPRARPFFDEFHTHQDWEFYYLHSPSARYTGPFLFVTVEQFTRFLGIINSRLGTKLAIPVAHAKRFSYKFGKGGTPRPRYLGKVYDVDSSTRLLGGKAWPACGEEALKYGEASSSARDKVRQTLDEISKYLPGEKKKSSAVKAARNRERRKDMMGKLQDALGLKPWETSSTASKDLGFGVDKAPAFPPERAPVLVAIDVEVNEFRHDEVTEVGFAILDTEKTKNMAPGELGEAWWSLVESKHFRIMEFANHCNRKFVNGCPDRFNFGTSDFVPQKRLLKEIDEIFTQYKTRISPTGKKTERDIVLVGHDVSSDDKYLATVGYNLATKNIIFRADSKDLHQHLRNADQGPGLVSVLFDFRMHATNLHNAGNDATYTLRAAIACAIEGMKEQVKPQEAPEKTKSVEDGGCVSEGSGYEDKQDVTWVPGKTYYYSNDRDDDNLPMVL